MGAELQAVGWAGTGFGFFLLLEVGLGVWHCCSGPAGKENTAGRKGQSVHAVRKCFQTKKRVQAEPEYFQRVNIYLPFAFLVICDFSGFQLLPFLLVRWLPLVTSFMTLLKPITLLKYTFVLMAP